MAAAETAKMRMEMSAAQGLSSFFTVFGTNKRRPN